MQKMAQSVLGPCGSQMWTIWAVHVGRERALLQIPYGMPHIESHMGPMWVLYALLNGMPRKIKFNTCCEKRYSDVVYLNRADETV